MSNGKYLNRLKTMQSQSAEWKKGAVWVIEWMQGWCQRASSLDIETLRNRLQKTKDELNGSKKP